MLRARISFGKQPLVFLKLLLCEVISPTSLFLHTDRFDSISPSICSPRNQGTIMFQVFKPGKDHRYHERHVALCLLLPTRGIKCWHLQHSSNGWKFDPEENEERETSRTIVMLGGCTATMTDPTTGCCSNGHFQIESIDCVWYI